MAFCKTRAAVAALSVALLAACGDSGPSQFNATAMNSDLAQLTSVETNTDLSQVFSGVGQVLDGPAVASIGRLAIRPLKASDAKLTLATLKSVRSQPAISASAAIPPEAAGKTWVYNSETQAYEVSDLTGAPSNGVRILLYEQDINGDFILPLVETGHVDLTDLSSGSTGKGRLQAVKGSTTFLDYTVTATGDDTDGSIGVTGFLTTAAGRLDVDFSVDGTVNGSTSTFDMQSSLDFPSHDLHFDVAMNGSVNDDAQTGAYSVTETIESPNGRMDLVGSAGYSDDFTFTIKVNGDTWATYDGSTLTPVDGRTLTGDEQQALTGAAELTVVGVLLPLSMVLVMAVLTGSVPGLPL
jgi:predicted small lipoprotein YifL